MTMTTRTVRDPRPPYGYATLDGSGQDPVRVADEARNQHGHLDAVALAELTRGNAVHARVAGVVPRHVVALFPIRDEPSGGLVGVEAVDKLDERDGEHCLGRAGVPSRHRSEPVEGEPQLVADHSAVRLLEHGGAVVDDRLQRHSSRAGWREVERLLRRSLDLHPQRPAPEIVAIAGVDRLDAVDDRSQER